MSKWYNSLAGSASFAQLRPRTKSGLRNSILLMALCTLTISMDLSGFFASNARKHITLTVFGQIKSNQLGGPFCAPLMSAGSGEKSKRVTPIKLTTQFKRVIFKQVIVPIPVAKQKETKKKLPHRGKDGRHIGPRRAASSGKGKKEQTWTEADIEEAFDLWEANPSKKPEEQLSKRQISQKTGVPYTTVCERLSGRRGGGKRGKITGGKRTGKVLDEGKQAGSQAGNRNWTYRSITRLTSTLT